MDESLHAGTVTRGLALFSGKPRSAAAAGKEPLLIGTWLPEEASQN
jgi:hypothetical protein